MFTVDFVDGPWFALNDLGRDHVFDCRGSGQDEGNAIIPFRSPYLSAVAITGTALLMVSKVPTVSLKRIVRIPHDMVLPTLLGVGIFAGFFTTAPWPTLIAIGLVYLGSIPLTVRAYYRLRRAAGARRREPAARPDTPLPAPPPAPFPPAQDHAPSNEWRH